MKNLFLNFSLKTVVLLFVLLSVSCKKENDEVNPLPTANTELGNVKYTIKNGFIHNGGTVDFFLDDEAETKTHFNYDFILTDGTPTFHDGNVVSMNDGKIIISSVLLSPGTTAFKTGTFEFDDWSTVLELDDDELMERYQNKYFFPIALVFTDTDGDRNWQEEVGTYVTGGTIKVTGTAPNYTIEYDLVLANEKTLKGSFAGNFNTVGN